MLDLSSHPAVRRVVALGTILIVELKEHDGAPGYQSQVTIFFSQSLSCGILEEMYLRTDFSDYFLDFKARGVCDGVNIFRTLYFFENFSDFVFARQLGNVGCLGN